VEWAKHNVRVNAIIPGVIPTDLNKKALKDKKRLRSILLRTPMKRLGKTKEIVSAALFLAVMMAGSDVGAGDLAARVTSSFLTAMREVPEGLMVRGILNCDLSLR